MTPEPVDLTPRYYCTPHGFITDAQSSNGKMNPREPYQICDPKALGAQLARERMGESVDAEWWKYYEEFILWEKLQGEHSQFRADMETGASAWLADLKHLWLI